MPILALQRCFNHALREAAARCPECGKFFCRECVTEHDDRVVCTHCLAQLAGRRHARRFPFAAVIRYASAVAGLMLAWFFFFLIGAGLLKLPDSFHDGTLWQIHWLDQE